MDSKDLVMCHRNMVRAGIDLAKVRGGDNRNMIQEARKKAQHNLANSVFTKFSVPTNNKIY